MTARGTLSFGPYVALQPLASGPDADGTRDGWSHVRWWRGRSTDSHEPVLIGVVPSRHADAARTAAARAADLNHDHLLPLLDVVDGVADVGMVLRWPGAESLQSVLHRRGTLRAGEIVTVLAPVAAALAAIHAANLVYGSVGSATIWLDDAGRPALLPLAAALLEQDLDGSLPGTVGDLSPEVARGQHVTAASDVFSLGSVLLQCLTGEAAWPADDAADVLVQSAAGLWPDAPRDAGPPELVALLRRMLSAEPEARPPAAGIPARLAATAPASPIDMHGESRHLTADSDHDAAVPDVHDEGAARIDDEPAARREPGPGADGGRRCPQRRVLGVAVGVVAAALLAVAAAQAGLWWARSDGNAAAPVGMTLATPATDGSASRSPAADGTAPGSAGAGGTAAASAPDEINWQAVVLELDARRAQAFVTPGSGAPRRRLRCRRCRRGRPTRRPSSGWPRPASRSAAPPM